MGGRHLSIRRDGEEEFVVLTAMDGVEERCAWRDGEEAVDGRRKLGFEAEAMEVEGKAVAEVHAGRGMEFFAEALPEGQARFGDVCVVRSGGAAQETGDIDGIATPGAGTGEGFPLGTSPMTMMSAAVVLARVRSPPARMTLCCLARVVSPL